MTSSMHGGVVVGLDRSPQGWAAVELAANMAARRHLPLTLIHAFEPSQYMVRPAQDLVPDATGVLRNAAQRLSDDALDVVRAFHPGLVVESRVEPGSAVALLLEASEHANLVVVGSRGTGGFTELLLGSTTLHVAGHASCPVIAVPAPGEETRERRGIVVGVDGSPRSEAAIAFAFQEADELGEGLTALHTWYDITRTGTGTMMPLGYDPREVLQEERLALAESMAGWQEKFPGVAVRNRVVTGHPVQALVAESQRSQMLVVGSRGLGPVGSIVLGSVSHGVLHHASAPVAVVHAR
jgi:nucleotide-binding universal stress UspA family protein